MNQIDLKDQHAVITGGAQGIGLAIASRLISSGASVSLWDRDEASLTTALDHLNQTGAASGEARRRHQPRLRRIRPPVHTP